MATAGESFKDARTAAGLLQRDVAAKAEVSVPFVSMVENGYQPRSPIALGRMAQVVGASYGSFWEPPC